MDHPPLHSAWDATSLLRYSLMLPRPHVTSPERETAQPPRSRGRFCPKLMQPGHLDESNGNKVSMAQSAERSLQVTPVSQRDFTSGLSPCRTYAKRNSSPILPSRRMAPGFALRLYQSSTTSALIVEGRHLFRPFDVIIVIHTQPCVRCAEADTRRAGIPA